MTHPLATCFGTPSADPDPSEAATESSSRTVTIDFELDASV